jgi:hypothetical protein
VRSPRGSTKWALSKSKSPAFQQGFKLKNFGAEGGTLRDGTLTFLNNNVKKDASRKQVKTQGKRSILKFLQ